LIGGKKSLINIIINFRLHKKVPDGKDVYEYIVSILQTMISEETTVVDDRLLDMNMTQEDIDIFMRNISPRCDEIMHHCQGNKRAISFCHELFEMVHTDEGFCCSFNGAVHDMEPEHLL
jgi:hypothetical protein